ncbi:MAG: hypothetical protein KDK48_06425, partial [Chlamydiia bacterium]|nr:hypothetical protein [Chlamydiia bacterium]
GPFVSGTLTLFYTLDAFDALATIHDPVRAFEAKDTWLWGETREERIHEIRREKALELAGCVTKVAQQVLIFAAVTQPELILAFGLISSGTVVVRYFIESDSGRALFKESSE